MSEEEINLRQGVPQTTGIHKRNTIIAISVIFFAVLIVITFAVNPKKTEKQTSDALYGNTKPGEIISALPENYMSLGDKKPKVFSNEQIYHDETQKSKNLEDKFLEQERLRRLKRAVKARESDLSFKNVDIREDKKFNFSSLPTSASESPNLNSNFGDRDSDNRQDDKFEFLNRERNSDAQLTSPLRKQSSPYTLLAGNVIPGVLLTGINSDLPGEIVGQVIRNIFDTVSGEHLLIPQGTRVIGEYDSRVTFGQSRVLIVWTRLLFPNGNSISLEGMPGVDMSGYAGLSDTVNNHYRKLLTGVLFGSVLSAGAQMARGSNRTVDPEFSQLALEGAAQNINQAGQTITRKNLNIQPTIEIRQGMRFNIFVTKDITLENY